MGNFSLKQYTPESALWKKKTHSVRTFQLHSLIRAFFYSYTAAMKEDFTVKCSLSHIVQDLVNDGLT